MAIDLKELQERLEKALNAETAESLQAWLDSQPSVPIEKEEGENELKIRLGQGIADILYENNGSSAGAIAVLRYLTKSFTIKRKQ